MHARTPQLVTDMAQEGSQCALSRFLTAGITHLGGRAINTPCWRYRRRLEPYVGEPNIHYTPSEVPATQNKGIRGDSGNGLL